MPILKPFAGQSMCVILLKIKRFALLGRFIYSFEYLRYNKCLLGLGADLGVIDNGVDEDRKVVVCERLSYPDENIVESTLKQIAQSEFTYMCIMVIY